MPSFHRVLQSFRRLLHRARLLRRLSLTTTLLTLVWLWALNWGEYTVFHRHIDACKWESWESWPQGATPHHLVLIADPQLVDPHTYPGRPWPLSTLTERYTDAYMAHNFRLINSKLDPDSVVFLGDLFDGGREWAPGIVARLTRRRYKNIKYRDVQKDGSYIGPKGGPPQERIVALDEDLKAFVPGENGRWKRYSDFHWKKDLKRFSKIFWSPRQLHPDHQRTHFPAFDVSTDVVSFENGAANKTWHEYATDVKTRKVIASLPGNHDLGFGAGVQWRIRDRFQQYFGDGNRIDVLGNHTFIGIDAPSLSALSQWLPDGKQTTGPMQAQHDHIWKPTVEFLDNIEKPAQKAVSDHLRSYFPLPGHQPIWQHEVNEVTIGRPTRPHNFTHTDQLPVVLLTHVPLFRDHGVNCGPMRERGTSIPIAFGYQYQNVLTPDLSQSVVSKVQAAGEIAHVFSGDDHDYCDYIHSYNLGSTERDQTGPGLTTLKHIREITVKSFSWAMGVRHPGFELVSLWNPIDANGETIGVPLPTIQTHLCILPDQLSIFINYAMLLALTLIILLVRAIALALRSPEIRTAPLIPSWVLSKKHQNKQANGYANGFANGHAQSRQLSRSPSTSASRERATSNATSTNHHHSRNGMLGVQRSHSTRTRSISPAPYTPGADSFRPTPGTLVEKAGYFPKIAWQDPGENEDEEESDEESRVGDWAEKSNLSDSTDADSDGGINSYDEKQKSKWRRRGRRRRPGAPSKFLVTMYLFRRSLFVVGVPCFIWYIYLGWL